MDFVFWPSATVFFLFFDKRTMPYNKKLTDFDFAIARSIQQDLGFICSRTALTLSQYKLLISIYKFHTSSPAIKMLYV